MIRVKCRCCKNLFEIEAKGSWTTRKYCDDCIKQMKSISKQNSKNEQMRNGIKKGRGKIKPFGYWIIDNINIPLCNSCNTAIAYEKLLTVDKYDEYYKNKRDYENNDNKNDDMIIINDAVEYDYEHGDIICKKCKTIIGRLELYDY